MESEGKEKAASVDEQSEKERVGKGEMESEGEENPEEPGDPGKPVGKGIRGGKGHVREEEEEGGFMEW